jgi:hypothetical protein
VPVFACSHQYLYFTGTIIAVVGAALIFQEALLIFMIVCKCRRADTPPKILFLHSRYRISEGEAAPDIFTGNQPAEGTTSEPFPTLEYKTIIEK